VRPHKALIPRPEQKIGQRLAAWVPLRLHFLESFQGHKDVAHTCVRLVYFSTGFTFPGHKHVAHTCVRLVYFSTGFTFQGHKPVAHTCVILADDLARVYDLGFRV
jgi:hypothetical protein